MLSMFKVTFQRSNLALFFSMPLSRDVPSQLSTLYTYSHRFYETRGHVFDALSLSSQPLKLSSLLVSFSSGELVC